MISMSTSFAKALVLLFLPYLSAFLFQSNRLLRTYIAVVAAPVPTPPPPEPEQTSNGVDVNTPSTTSGYKGRIIPAILVLSELSLGYWYIKTVFSHPTGKVLTLQAAIEFFFSACLLILVINIAIQIIYPSKDIIHRTPNGKYVTVIEGGLGLAANQHPFFILWLILSIILFAYLMVVNMNTNDSLPIAVVTMAFVASLMMLGKMPLQTLVEAYSFLILVIVLAVFKYSNARILKPEEDEVWTTNLFKTLRHVTFLPAALSSFCSGPLIAAMLRFDFNRFCIAEPHAKISYETAPHPSDPRMGEGIVVPQNVPVKFSKPYYTLALSTWSIIRIATLDVCIVTGFPFKSPHDACALVGLLEFPIVTIVLLLFATVRGEARALWGYREVWVKESSIVEKTAKENELVMVECELLLHGEDKVVPPNEDLMV